MKRVFYILALMVYHPHYRIIAKEIFESEMLPFIK